MEGSMNPPPNCVERFVTRCGLAEATVRVITTPSFAVGVDVRADAPAGGIIAPVATRVGRHSCVRRRGDRTRPHSSFARGTEASLLRRTAEEHWVLEADVALTQPP